MGPLGDRIAARARLRDRLRRRADVPAPAPRRPTMVDPDAQARFERDGYVVVDLLDHAGIDRLRSAHSGMDHTPTTSWPFVEGFHTSVYDPRPEYRSTVLRLLEAEFGPPLSSILQDYRIMWANFLAKEPNAHRVPLHVDWTFLDEDRFSSVTVWCPLADTDETNGALGVVAGSHRRVDFVRAVNVPCYDECERIASELGDHRVIPLEAGRAIVMDNRTIHFSTPNERGAPRLVAAAVLGPTECELHHYWRDPQDRLLRFELDRSFYLHYDVGQPPAEVEGALHSTLVESSAVPR